jgi:hypothetical protein
MSIQEDPQRLAAVEQQTATEEPVPAERFVPLRSAGNGVRRAAVAVGGQPRSMLLALLITLVATVGVLVAVGRTGRSAR